MGSEMHGLEHIGFIVFMAFVGGILSVAGCAAIVWWLFQHITIGWV